VEREEQLLGTRKSPLFLLHSFSFSVFPLFYLASVLCSFLPSLVLLPSLSLPSLLLQKFCPPLLVPPSSIYKQAERDPPALSHRGAGGSWATLPLQGKVAGVCRAWCPFLGRVWVYRYGFCASGRGKRMGKMI
jgi:hypothetical protein